MPDGWMHADMVMTTEPYLSRRVNGSTDSNHPPPPQWSMVHHHLVGGLSSASERGPCGLSVHRDVGFYIADCSRVGLQGNASVENISLVIGLLRNVPLVNGSQALVHQ